MQLVFNLYPFSETLYLPAAYLAQTDRDGHLTYFVQRATPATCAPYQVEITPEIARLLNIIDLLTPKAIEAHFKPAKAKTTTSLSELLKPQNPTKATVDGYIFRHLSNFLSEIVKNGFHLALDAEKRTLIKDVQVLTKTEPLVPHLSFKKTPAGIEYRFELGTETEKWPITKYEVIALSNTDPAWIMVDYALFQVPGVNGFMVNPFRKKEVVMIPPEQVKTYFKKFIARNAGRNHIEAEGFNVQVSEKLLRSRLSLVEDILHKIWVLKPIFEYENAVFDYGEKRNNITTVEFSDEADEVLVKKIARDTEAESAKIDTLLKAGLEFEHRVGQPQTDATGNGSLMWWIGWLSKHRLVIEKNNFTLDLPEIDGKPVALLAGTISVETKASGDWFDVYGKITAGEFSFTFADLVPYLRNNDPLYPLPDGTWFLIPEEWFARYSDLARALRDNDRLPKALFTLLQDAGDEALVNSEDFPVIDPETIDYQPDDSLKATLRPYQLFGVKWLIGHYRHGFGACLADSMGLGKTLQTIAVLLHAKSQHQEDATEITPPEKKAEPAKTVAPATTGFQLDLFNPHHQDLAAPAMEIYSPTPVVRHLEPHPSLIILPASLVFNWQNELERFAPSLFVRVHTGPQREKDHRALAMHDVVLTTYHTARADLELLQKINWHFIILDESQWIKNRDSEISKMVRSIDSDHKISLSGTPIENSLADLWTQMEFINPSILGSYKSFREQFQLPIERNNDAVAREQLFSRVRPFFLRRTKEEVTPDLPLLTEQVFYSEMSQQQRSMYEEIKSAMRNEILNLFDDPKTRMLAIQALTRLRQLANHPVLTDKEYEGDSGKTEDVLAQWDTIRKDGHKVLFFSSFVQHLEVFRQIFEKEGTPYVWLTGETPQAERGAIIERFQKDDSIQAFLCTVKAGGVGLNLTAASYVFLLDPWWNPASEDQAIARAHRIGQSKPVNAIRFISRDSIEEKIRQLQVRKKALGQELFAPGNELPEFTREDLAGLFD